MDRDDERHRHHDHGHDDHRKGDSVFSAPLDKISYCSGKGKDNGEGSQQHLNGPHPSHKDLLGMSDHEPGVITHVGQPKDGGHRGRRVSVSREEEQQDGPKNAHKDRRCDSHDEVDTGLTEDQEQDGQLSKERHIAVPDEIPILEHVDVTCKGAVDPSTALSCKQGF
jgi:hypothetical protein